MELTMEPKKTGMTLEEVKSAIKFKKYEVSRPFEGVEAWGIKATLELSSTIELDKHSIRYIPNWSAHLENVKENLRREIIYTLFESRRQELVDAVMRLFKTDEREFREYTAARENLCRVVGLQPDKTITDYLTEQERKEADEISSPR